MATSSFITPSLQSELSADWSEPQLLYVGEINAMYTANRYGKKYVLKALRPELRASVPHQEQLEKEFQIGLPLEHPNIVRTLDWGFIEAIGSYIQLEYVDGITLSEFLTTKPKLKIRLQILHELLQAVEYLHQHQIIHRDLKPSNILITRNGYHVKVIDMGIADADDYVALKQPAGSYAFIAPEQLKGEVLDGRADIYSLGKIIRLLFPVRYGWIARKCCRIQRNRRFSTCAQLQAAIRRADWRRIGLPLLALVVGLLFGWYQLYRQQMIRLQNEQHQHENALQAAMDSINTTREEQKQRVATMQAAVDSINTVREEQKQRVATMQVAMDSLNTIIVEQNQETERVRAKIKEQEAWERMPTEEESQAVHKRVLELKQQYKDEMLRAWEAGELNHISKRDSFFAPLRKMIATEKRKFPNAHLQKQFEDEFSQDMGFTDFNEIIFRQLPLYKFYE